MRQLFAQPRCALIWGASLLTVVAVSAPSSAYAQGVCTPSGNSNEAKLLSFFAVPLSFSSALPAPALTAGQVAIAVEASYVGSPSSDTRRTDNCFLAKSQNTELSPVLPRPRVAIGLPGGVTAELSYLPPITVADATPSLLGLSLSYGLPVNGGVAVMARVHATVGHVNGAITCAASSLQNNPALPCFGTAPSDDRYSPNVYGFELLTGVQLTTHWRAIGGVGVAHGRPRFQVGFVNGFDLLDDTRVAYNFTQLTGSLGASRRVNDRIDVGVIGYGMLSSGATLRLTGQWRLRK